MQLSAHCYRFSGFYVLCAVYYNEHHNVQRCQSDWPNLLGTLLFLPFLQITKHYTIVYTVHYTIYVTVQSGWPNWLIFEEHTSSCHMYIELSSLLHNILNNALYIAPNNFLCRPGNKVLFIVQCTV